MSPNRLLACLLCFAGLILAGCQSYLKTGDIVATVDGLRPVALAEGRAIVTLRFVNDSVVPMSFTESTHQLYLNGVLAASFENKHPVGLAPQTATTREFPIQLVNPAVLQQLVAHGPARTAFRLESQMLVQDGDSKSHFKSQSEGTVALAPPAAP
ncbi:MAG: hypothetical protein ACHQ4G_03515 [Opitutales bacterium]